MVRNMEFAAGELYSASWDGDGTFRVVKVLAVDDEAVHVRVYKERFPVRPATVDHGELTLGSVEDADGFGVGHPALALKEFELWDPELIGITEVDDDELDGYRMWASEPDAGVFAPKPTLISRLRTWLGRG